MFRQTPSDPIIQHPAVGSFSQKTEGPKTKAARVLFLICNLDDKLLRKFYFLDKFFTDTEIRTIAEKASWDPAN